MGHGGVGADVVKRVVVEAQEGPTRDLMVVLIMVRSLIWYVSCRLWFMILVSTAMHRLPSGCSSGLLVGSLL